MIKKIVVALIFLSGLIHCGWARALDAGSNRELAVEIAYRLDRELGEVDAAQRHLLVWRLLTAKADGELAQGDPISDRWLEWQQTVEELERRIDLTRLPVWHQPASPDEVTALLAAEVADIGPLQWLVPIESPELATTGVRLVTNRNASLQASAQYPALLAWARSHAATIWLGLLDELSANPELLPLLEPLVASWLALPLDQDFASWRELQDQSKLQLDRLYDKQARSGDPLLALAAEVAATEIQTVRSSNEETGRLALARYGLFLNRDTADALDWAILSLADGVSRIETGGFQSLVETLASLTYLLIMRTDLIDSRPRLTSVLDDLGRMDSWLLPQIGRVDKNVLSVYQQIRILLRDWHDQAASGNTLDRGSQLRTLATLNASLELTATDLDGYLSQPFREAFEIQLLVCFAQGAVQKPFPAVPISQRGFEDCIEHFVDWATVDSTMPELAGESVGRFEPNHLQRELDLVPVQRINYWFGFVGNELGSECGSFGETALVNPFEWALSARAFAWLANRWPAYYVALGMQAKTRRLIASGQLLLQARDHIAKCFRENSQDPLLVLIDRYQQSLEATAAAIDQATADFRALHLKPDADLKLDGNAAQLTRYRPVDRPVRPCNPDTSCEMSEPLEATRALYELFPVAYLLADQIDLGQVSLCYDRVQWVDRRAELPSAKIQAMANYFGYLSFELRGEYSGQTEPVFRLGLVGNNEYEYLFGENSPEVLDNPCPRDLIGTQVRAELPKRKIQLVPRRLTYMTADRTHPARVFEQQWAQDDQWRDWFVTGNGVEVLGTNEPDSPAGRVNSRLQTLNSAWNREVYRQMLESDEVGLDGPSPLAAAMHALDLHKRTLVTVAGLLLPERIKHQAALRATLFGEDGFFGRRNALHMQNNKVPVQMTARLARSHLQDAQYLWQTESARSARRTEQTHRLISTTLLELATLRDRHQ